MIPVVSNFSHSGEGEGPGGEWEGVETRRRKQQKGLLLPSHLPVKSPTTEAHKKRNEFMLFRGTVAEETGRVNSNANIFSDICEKG